MTTILVKYNDNYQKIAMGFMSYMTDLKDLDHLQMELQLYTSDDQHQLFLYKQHGGDFIGIVAVELQEQAVMIRYLSFNPAYRMDQTLFAVFDELQEYYPNKKVMGTISLATIVEKWQQQKN
ncbi:N-acetyltransferase [Bombilactobacillus thymidiniphilus]|uniref:N-acetyltransferase n=1 Tax=Bombilactobacillus thymidiniphilus TaxID=2923363 RepID=A0ABY4PDN1_9LACO|nr:N-acetyltransferase [Bombilactobacillus thymidiniphilus]UQS83725.1 N-acetyltransferase [Bombilactobacillus thymidiniphilus]